MPKPVTNFETYAAPRGRGTVVVADDDVATRMLLCQILRAHQYQVFDAENGRQACDMVHRERPDVVLMDWSMPVMDGLAAVKALRSDRTTRHIPVIMLTTQAEMDDKVEAIEGGVQDFVTKPCHPRELVARVDQQRRWRDTLTSATAGGVGTRDVAATEVRAGELKRAALEIERLRASAMRDALTGLPNRLLLYDRIDQAILSSKRRKERFAMLFVDLDGFKAINDGYGHAVGDHVLKTVAARFEKIIRESDTVARIGGDEFVVLAPRIAAPENARELSNRLVEAIRRPVYDGGRELSVSASVGVSLYPIDAVEREGLIRCADAAMYRSKRTGKDRFTFANEDVFTDEALWESAFSEV